MHSRKNSGRFHTIKKSTSKEANKTDADESVHHRNVRHFALPVLLFFYFIRFVAFHLWIGLTKLYQTSVYFTKNEASNSCIAPPSPRKNIEQSNVTMSKSAPGPGEPALAAQKHHHRKAFEYVSKALKLDEEDKGRKDLAVELYKKGIDELEKGIAVDVNGPGKKYFIIERCLI